MTDPGNGKNETRWIRMVFDAVAVLLVLFVIGFIVYTGLSR